MTKMQDQSKISTDVFHTIISNLDSFLKGIYKYIHVEDETISENFFCKKIQEIIYNILDQLIKLYLTENPLVNSIKKDSVQMNLSNNLESQIREVLSYFKVGMIYETKKSSIQVIQEFIRSIGNFLIMILPDPTLNHKRGRLNKRILDFKAKLDDINNQTNEFKELNIEELCKNFIYPLILLFQKNKSIFRAELKPIIKKIDFITKKFEKIPKSQKKEIFNYSIEIFSQNIPNAYPEVYFRDYDLLIERAISINKEDFIKLFQIFDKKYKAFPSRAKYYKNIKSVQNLQFFIKNYESLKNILHSKEGTYKFGKEIGKLYYRIYETNEYNEYIKKNPELQGDSIHYNLEYIKVKFEQMSFFYGYILGLIDIVNIDFDSTFSEYFTLNRFTLNNTYYSKRKIHKNNAWIDLNKPSVKNGLRQLGLNQLEKYFDGINQQTRKYRNYFGHKEGLIVQDKLSERLYKIHSIEDGIEYVSFENILETKELLSNFVEQFIGYIYIYILKKKLILNFIPIT